MRSYLYCSLYVHIGSAEYCAGYNGRSDYLADINILRRFVLDVKNALLFGGEPHMAFRDIMNLRIPTDRNMAWYAQTSEEWETAISNVEMSADPHSFFELIKEFWQSPHLDLCASERISGSITLMYGILSVARNISWREDNNISQRSSSKSSFLSKTVERALLVWETAWR
jgi:hypothetical protein